MAVKALTELSLQDRDVTIQVEVNRKWEFRGSTDDGPILHIDMILTDAMGNVIYAEIPAKLIQQKGSLLQLNKVYYIRRFRVANMKSQYKVLNAPFMIYFTIYSIIDLCRDPPSTFPLYIYNLNSYDAIDANGPKSKDFHDVLGMITEVSEIKPIQLGANSSMYRNVFIKNLSDDIIKVTLWGNRALQFSYETIYDQQKQDAIVVLFVGCLPKEYKASVYLSGGAACHWYFNPSITEAQPYYERIHNENITIELPPLSNTAIVLPDPDLKDLLDSDQFTLADERYTCTVTITRILDDKPWWYRACNACPHKPSIQSSVSSCRTCGSTDVILRYKLTFMASDGTAEMRMFCFDGIAKRIIGKSCTSLLSSVTSTSTIPPDLAAIISLKFTFAVVYNEMSYEELEKELLIKSVIASHGRDLSLPSPKLNIPVYPSTPNKLLAATKQTVSPSTAMSKLSTSISPNQQDNLQSEDEDLESFESPPKRARHRSLKFKHDETDSDRNDI